MTRLGWAPLLVLIVAAPGGAATATFTPTFSAQATDTVSPNLTPSSTASPVTSATASPSPSPSATANLAPPSPTLTPTPSPSATESPAASPSATSGFAGTPTATPSFTFFPSPSPASGSPTAAVNLPPPSNQDASFVYPNPVPHGGDAWVVYTLDGPGDVNLRIYNSAGDAAAQVDEHQAAGGRQRSGLPTGSFAPGVYLYSLRFNYDDGHQGRLPLGHFVVGRR